MWPREKCVIIDYSNRRKHQPKSDERPAAPPPTYYPGESQDTPDQGERTYVEPLN